MTDDREIFGKLTNMWKLNNTLLNKQISNIIARALLLQRLLIDHVQKYREEGNLRIQIIETSLFIWRKYKLYGVQLKFAFNC